MRLVSAGIAMLLLIAAASTAKAQDVFRNPAMEGGEESQSAFLHGRELMRNGRFDEAISAFRNSIKLRKEGCPECYEMIGSSYMQLGKYKEAAGAYREALGQKPGNEAELHNGLGVALFLSGDKSLYDESAAEFQRAIDLSQGRVVKAYYNLGHVLIKAGKIEEGKTALKTYLEKQP